MRSRLPNAQDFQEWVFQNVLPAIRKFGIYRIQQNHLAEMHQIFDKINYLEDENKLLKNNLRNDKYPDGGMVYVIDHSTDEKEIYRIGMTSDMNKRKKVHDTHTFDKKVVVYYKLAECPEGLEICIRAMLYQFRYKNRKDFYICSLDTIKSAFKNCIKSLNCVKSQAQSGGSMETIIDNEIIKCKKAYRIKKYIVNYMDTFF
jgi:hypothetical protein